MSVSSGDGAGQAERRRRRRHAGFEGGAPPPGGGGPGREADAGGTGDDHRDGGDGCERAEDRPRRCHQGERSTAQSKAPLAPLASSGSAGVARPSTVSLWQIAAGDRRMTSTARWIAPIENDDLPDRQRPAYQLAGAVTLEGAVASATVRSTAHGIYEAFVNGTRVGDEELTPGWTAYRSAPAGPDLRRDRAPRRGRERPRRAAQRRLVARAEQRRPARRRLRDDHRAVPPARRDLRRRDGCVVRHRRPAGGRRRATSSEPI